MGEHLRLDLRHELTHALLNGGLAAVPLWLDEGLASFFEQPPSADGINYEHLDKLTKTPSLANLPRLESIKLVQDMGKDEYREAWAWTHTMLRGDAQMRAVLLDYLQMLRTEPEPGSLYARLAVHNRNPNLVFTQHLDALRRGDTLKQVSLKQGQ